MPVALSILDLAPIAPGRTARDSFAASVELARTAERTGYERVWYAEHHSMPTIASSATSLVIGHVAEHTETIRLGAGGIMLPNHSPLVIAEQFGTLESLFPGRIDLGLGRAPGTDRQTMRAIRRDATSSDTFPQDVLELQGYLRGKSLIEGVEAVPTADTEVPLYLLGSSLFGAQLAASLGLPYAFASHFAPDALHEAIAVYREQFRPSGQLPEPYVIAGVNVFAADDPAEAEAQRRIAFRNRARAFIARGPVGREYTDDEIDEFLASPAGDQLNSMARYTAVGGPEDVRAFLESFAAATGADELITVHYTEQVPDRLRSVEITAAAMGIG
ncbi:LLM class flavin-dependent oxidoreductase [Glycomyces sp. NPDC047369]